MGRVCTRSSTARLLASVLCSHMAWVGRAQTPAGQDCAQQCGSDFLSHQPCNTPWCEAGCEWQLQQQEVEQEVLAHLQEGNVSLAEEEKLLALDSAGDNAAFGYSVAVSGRVTVVGAPRPTRTRCP